MRVLHDRDRRGIAVVRVRIGGALSGRHRGGVAVGQRRIDQAAIVDVGLGHRVVRGVVPGLAEIELAVAVEVAADIRQIADRRVADDRARQRHVAVIGDVDRVVDHVAGRVRGAVRHTG